MDRLELFDFSQRGNVARNPTGSVIALVSPSEASGTKRAEMGWRTAPEDAKRAADGSVAPHRKNHRVLPRAPFSGSKHRDSP